MQANNRTDAGCTVDAVPYKVLDLEASKLNFAGPDVKATPVMAVPLVLENAPVGVVPFVFPTGWNVPVMFGPNITGYLCKSDFSNDTSYTGVFSQTERGSAWSGGSSGYENTWDRPYFSARAANSTYGSSSVVQPASIRLMLCIKI